jgi:AraC family transcriptional regulator, dual regulator of chb operon
MSSTIRFATLGVLPHRAHIQVTRLKPGQRSSLHRHDFYEVLLVLQGSGRHHLNGQTLALQPGDLVLLQPQDGHCFSTSAEETLAFINVAVAADWWQALHAALGWDAWLPGRQSTRLTPAEAEGLGAELGALAAGAQPLSLLQAWSRVRDYLMRGARPAAEQVPAWLEALRLDMAQSPESLAEPIGYWQARSARSPEHLARSCRRHYGITFSELLSRARVERARQLLRTSDAKVIAIALDCGFGNMAHFHRVFLRLTGMTPQRWRMAGTAVVPLPE